MEHVYIGKGADDRYFKIGRTSRFQESRLKQHKTANPSFEYCRMIPTSCASGLEKMLHQWFGSKRVPETKEWFDLQSNDLDIIPLLADGFEEKQKVSEDAAALKGLRTSGVCIEPSGSINEDYQRLRTLREQQARIEHEIEFIESRMKLHIGTSDGIVGLISWKSIEERRFDSRTFQARHPDLYEQFRIPAIKRMFRVL